MHNRRKFLLQSTLAAGSFVFSNPSKARSLSFSDSSSVVAEKLSILNLHNLQNLSHKVSNLHPRLQQFFKNKNYTTLLLSTGNIVQTSNASKETHIEKLRLLKNAGCEAVVPQSQDLKNGLSYYEELTNECELTSLSKNFENNNLLPYHIVYKGNIKVGIIGNDVTQNGSIESDVNEMAARLNKTSLFLKNEACHLVVSMNPYNNGNGCSKKEEKALAALTKNIDVIVSSNGTLKQPTTFIVKNTERHDVVLNYQGTESSYLKNINISFNSRMEKTAFSLSKVL
ncbi:hypothetical protein [Segetibacter aerophilus]|uniref:Capsule synthesis protein CapA domain-containing protein n=1 Tax=Segetibacter aerophilus TaxID=670293 RepID=A0A512BDK5_9BACT|nr:hypothetical protein [Segetibacter aerophilus]GEO10039.1 hypothetical protein SAE01_25350 [Segetibacter aerophilus]